MTTFHMLPAPGTAMAHYVGDRLRVSLRPEQACPAGWRALLRTNLGRADRIRTEVIALAGARPSEIRTFAGASWRDIELPRTEAGWALDLAMTEVGHFRAKAYALDPGGRQHWPEGSDLGISVLPNHLRCANTLYCAFPRMHGPSRNLASTLLPGLEAQLRNLDAQGHTVIPPSGKLRDLTACVPHITETLGCRILHLLPLGPTPTTYARMGRFGSPYAQLDFTDIDPALVEFDRRSTAEDQFRELADAMHLRGGLVFLDIVINHTGWGSRLMAEHPDWFERDADGCFHSPGAWGNTWADLVELDHRFPELWETVAESLLTWCRRGVDGFRCDAGYMVPLPVWEYLQARVRQEFPNTVFLLEGLGGAWDLTESLLQTGGMQWAYSELFQNYTPREVSGYLDHTLRQSPRMGPLVHYSETHDNARLAGKGRTWSLLRNHLCALSSINGAWGFTGGVEWLATEKVDVHESRGLRWGAADNLLPELARLNHLLAEHPCFFDGAHLERLSTEDSPVLALARISASGEDRCLVLVNLDPDAPQTLTLSAQAWGEAGEPRLDLLGLLPPEPEPHGDSVHLTLAPGAAHCLSNRLKPLGLAGEDYRQARAQAAFALQALAAVHPIELLGNADWRELALRVDRDAAGFLAALSHLDLQAADLLPALDRAMALPCYPQVFTWSAEDAQRVAPLPPVHWLLLEDVAPFTYHLTGSGQRPLHGRSIAAGGRQVAAISPQALTLPEGKALDLDLYLERHALGVAPLRARIRRLALEPAPLLAPLEGLALLTNQRGGMARLQVDFGSIASKYDALLGANLHPEVPCDRHVLVKRLRAWANAEGFLTPLNADTLLAFEPGPPARWRFRVHAGDGRWVDLDLQAWMEPGENSTWLSFRREHSHDPGELPPEGSLSLTLRPDLEDRSYHAETQAGPGAEAHFVGNTSPSPGGFTFQPAPDRRLQARADRGTFHLEPEWCLGLPHVIEAGRGQVGAGDAWSPGWFEVPLTAGEAVKVCFSSEAEPALTSQAPLPPAADFESRLRVACEAFLARRREGLTVIAGYPWFLDWGRDTLIACRGLLAGGWGEEVVHILRTFGALEQSGTLPNALGGEDTSNRETSDAPLWFALACEEATALQGKACLDAPCSDGRSLTQILLSLAEGHLQGCPNGVRVDLESGLVWSPPHFTWMDTNHPAGSPREGYPIELQALWIRLLRFLDRLGLPCSQGSWKAWATKAEAHLDRYWREEAGCFSDCLHAGPDTPAAQAQADDHVRPNALFLVSLGLVEGERAHRQVRAGMKHLLVPGALRSLAPLPVATPLPIRGAWGQALNDPWHPYWGRYEDDEDTRRKPAYHNGTAWVWPMPTLCEALMKAWKGDPAARAAARALLGGLDRLLTEGCVGHLPEILDGDAPHTPRGCDAQAWSVTEALRVWRQT